MGKLNKVTARSVKAFAHPGYTIAGRPTTAARRMHAGGGLYLQVTAAGSKSWLFRYTWRGKPTWIGLGTYHESNAVSLADARVLAVEARRVIAGGNDPRAVRQASRVAAEAAIEAAAAEDEAAVANAEAAALEAEKRNFRTMALACIGKKSTEWRNAKHAAQWTATLTRHAFPILGAMDVASIDTADVRRVLQLIWAKTPETAQRVRGRIEAVLDYGSASGYRTGDNPARWRGHLKMLMGSPNRGRAHQPALPYASIGVFMEALARREELTARVLEFLILTASRTSEALGARWGEINLVAAVWTIPAERMKSGREHRIPLSEPALAILRSQQELADGPGSFVFQSGLRGGGTGEFSNMALTALLRRMNTPNDAGVVPWCDAKSGRPIVPHGFRSTFRDWVGDATEYAREVAEMALAHVNPDKTESSYARGDMLARRVPMMKEWAGWCLPLRD